MRTCVPPAIHLRSRAISSITRFILDDGAASPYSAPTTV